MSEVWLPNSETTERNEFETFPLFSFGIGTWVTNTTGLVNPAKPPVLAVATDVTAAIQSAANKLCTARKRHPRTPAFRFNSKIGTKHAFISYAKAPQMPS